MQTYRERFNGLERDSAATGWDEGRRKSLISTLLATLLAAAVLLPLLGHRMLTNWDEGIYAEVSREMLSSGWLVPHWNGQLWFEKPPLMLWITAAFFKLFGVTEFWARAGSAFSGVATVALLHGWLGHRKQLMTAWLNTLILLCTFGFLHVCRVGEMDVLLSLGCAIALCGLTAIDERATAGWYLFWGGFAIAAMTKGGASLVLPVTAILFAITERWDAARFGRHCWLGLVLFLLLVLPWHLCMLRWFGESFLNEYIGFHMLERATRPIERHTTHWWYYFWVLLVSAAPFVLLFPPALVDSLRGGRLRVWAIFSLVVIGLFTVVQTRLPHYIAPAYPALSVVTVSLLAERAQRFVLRYWPTRLFVRHSAQGRIAVSVIAVLVCGASVVLTSGARRRLHSATELDGQAAYDYREPVLLLQRVIGRRMAEGGSQLDGLPILTWWEGDRRSIATTVFYAQGRVQQVQPEALGNDAAFDRYTFNPMSFDQEIDQRMRLILLDTKLVPQLPQTFLYERLELGRTMEAGLIRRR